MRKPMTKLFEKESAFFEEHRSEWFSDHALKWVLIRSRKLHGFYDSDGEAYKAGMKLSGNKPFFLKQVLLEDPVIDIPALRHGLLRHPDFNLQKMTFIEAGTTSIPYAEYKKGENG